MTTSSVSIEDYLGAIYRMEPKDNQPLPLGELQQHFGFSPISIHEMIQKLVQRGMAEYIPYKGVLLTDNGRATAAALVRRHRIWECFLANELQVPIDEAHTFAGDLEHAAPDWITERLFTHLGQPTSCPHGSEINEHESHYEGVSLGNSEPGRKYLLTRISPETKNSLHLAREYGLLPGETVSVTGREEGLVSLEINGSAKNLQTEELVCFWGTDITDGS
jgi:DtxR family transcriptional regulator, Mn-dependent transcriptional regulator